MSLHAPATPRLVGTALLPITMLGGSCSKGGPLDPDDDGIGDRITAFTHVNVVPMTGDQVIPNQTVVVQGDRITELGPADQVQVEEGTTIIGSEGAYLMPGLADMHMHTRENWRGGSWPVSPLLLYLANGVTTIRDLGPAGSDLTYPLAWRESIENGWHAGPTVYASGIRIDDVPGQDVQGTVQWNHDQGFHLQKIYSYVSEGDFSLALAKARSLDFYTVGSHPVSGGIGGVPCRGHGRDRPRGGVGLRVRGLRQERGVGSRGMAPVCDRTDFAAC